MFANSRCRSLKRVSELQNHLYQPGDLVVYTVTKRSPHPGPRARSVYPSELGEDYSYVVDKFWMVIGIEGNDKVVIVTRKGKTRTVLASDPLLKKANWWQRFRYRDRFPGPDVPKPLDMVSPTSSVG